MSGFVINSYEYFMQYSRSEPEYICIPFGRVLIVTKPLKMVLVDITLYACRIIIDTLKSSLTIYA